MSEVGDRFYEHCLSIGFMAERCASAGQPASFVQRALDRFARAGILDGKYPPGRTAARLFTLHDLAVAKVALHLLGALRLDMIDIGAVAENIRRPPLAMIPTPRVTFEDCFAGWLAGETWAFEIMFLRNTLTGERKVMAAPVRPMKCECLVPAIMDSDGELVAMFHRGWVAEVNCMLDLNRVFESVFTDPLPADRVVH